MNTEYSRALLLALALLAACSRRIAEQPAIAPPRPADSAIEATATTLREGEIDLRFSGAASGSTCRMRMNVDGTVGTAPDVHPMTALVEAMFALVPVTGDELGLRWNAMRVNASLDGAELSFASIDASGLETRERGIVQNLRVANDPNAARLIDMLLGAPRIFVRLDERAVPITRRNELPLELQGLGDLIDGWSTWLLAMPVLPRIASVGQCWTGTRPLAVSASLKPTPEVQLRYCLASFDDSTAVITAEGASEGEFIDVDRDGKKALARWSLRGKATVARVGGRLIETELDGTADMMTTVQIPATMRFAGKMSCD